MAEDEEKNRPIHRPSLKDKTRRAHNRSVEERRRISESLCRRHRGAALNTRRKQKLLELQKDAEDGAPIIFNDEEMRLAVEQAIKALQDAVEKPERLRHVRYLRYLLTNSEDPPYAYLTQLGALSLFLDELRSEDKETRCESLWALAMMADGDLASVQFLLPKATVFIPFVDGSLGFDVAELAAWLFRSLASGMTDDHIMASLDVAGSLAQLMFACTDLKASADPHVVDASMTAAWALCSLVVHSVASRQHLLAFPQFSTRVSGLLASKNGRVVMEAAWLITYLVASDDAHLTALIQANVVPQFVQVLKLFLAERDPDLSVVYGVLTPVLRGLGNIAAGISADHVLELIQHDAGVILTCLSQCLSCDHRGIQKEACKTLSNICAACDVCSIDIFVNSSVLDKILYLVSQSAFDIKREAAFVLANICFNSETPNIEFLKFLVNGEHPMIPGIVSLMRGIDVDTIKLGLDFTKLILENIEDGPHRIEEADGIDALDNLQFGEIPADLQDLAVYLVDTYYGEDYGFD